MYVVGGAERNQLSPDGVLSLACGDFYQDLPEKVRCAIEFCAQNLAFERVVKVDDDVFINFENFYPVIESTPHDYFGKRTPSRAGIKPSSTWHYGKVSAGSDHIDVPFEIQGPPDHWAGGGLYVMNFAAAQYFRTPVARALSNYHLYEDFMTGDILARHGVLAHVWDSSAVQARGEWCVTNLLDVFEKDIRSIRDVDRVANSISIHCGSYAPNYVISESDLAEIFGIISEQGGIVSGSLGSSGSDVSIVDAWKPN
ncbi:hypothetical protein D3C81_343340 [compost metagenome]